MMADECINYDECGNETPGNDETENMICDDCLDAAREADRQ